MLLLLPLLLLLLPLITLACQTPLDYLLRGSLPSGGPDGAGEEIGLSLIPGYKVEVHLLQFRVGNKYLSTNVGYGLHDSRYMIWIYFLAL